MGRLAVAQRCFIAGAVGAFGAFGAFAVLADPPVPLVRRGGDSAPAEGYAETFPDVKRLLFQRINRERHEEGLGALAYDLLAARIGDSFCRDSAVNRTSGHWDLAGHPPYLRWGLGGGVDYEAENFSSLSRSGGPVEESEVEHFTLDAHAGMMAEKPPWDGHRRTVLAPEWTHVGLGIAIEGGEFRLVEEYSRRVALWVEVPRDPVPAKGRVPFAVKLPDRWQLFSIEVAFEKAPHPMSREEIRRRGSYSYPPMSQHLLSRGPADTRYPDGSRGEVDLVRGIARTDIALLSGAGDYYVFVFGAPAGASRRALSPLTAALIRAR